MTGVASRESAGRSICAFFVAAVMARMARVAAVVTVTAMTIWFVVSSDRTVGVKTVRFRLASVVAVAVMAVGGFTIASLMAGMAVGGFRLVGLAIAGVMAAKSIRWLIRWSMNETAVAWSPVARRSDGASVTCSIVVVGAVDSLVRIGVAMGMGRSTVGSTVGSHGGSDDNMGSGTRAVA